MKYHIERVCRMRFAAAAREHHVQIRLAPWDDETQSLIRVALTVEPETLPVARYDGFGNLSHSFAILSAHHELYFSLMAEVETRLEDPFDYAIVPPERELAWIADSLRQAPRLWDFVLHEGPLSPALQELMANQPLPQPQAGVPLLRQVLDMIAWLRGILAFDPQREAPASGLSELLDEGRGAAADLAHLLIALVRRLKVPARFVSGYLDAAYFDQDAKDPPDTRPRRQILHHWTEVLIPGGGWRGFDPALGLLADATYVRVAIGRDANDIPALRQSCRGNLEQLELEQTLSVSRID